MKFTELEAIYMISREDDDYRPWHGTVDDILGYIKEKGWKRGLESDSWEDIFAREGMIYYRINVE